MLPSNFDESNGSLDPPKGVSPDECHPLYVFRDGRHVVSCWRVTQDELDEINRTGRVWLTIWGPTMPPALPSGTYPFKVNEEKQPRPTKFQRSSLTRHPNTPCDKCGKVDDGTGHRCDPGRLDDEERDPAPPI